VRPNPETNLYMQNFWLKAPARVARARIPKPRSYANFFFENVAIIPRKRAPITGSSFYIQKFFRHPLYNSIAKKHLNLLEFLMKISPPSQHSAKIPREQIDMRGVIVECADLHIYSIYMNVTPRLRFCLFDITIKICYNNKKTLLQEKEKFWQQPLYSEYRKKHLNFHGILMIIAGPL